MTNNSNSSDTRLEVLKAEYSHQTDVHTAMMDIHKQVTDVHLVAVGILISGLVVGAAPLGVELATALLLPFGLTAVTWAVVINNMLFKLRYRFVIQLVTINNLRKRMFSQIDKSSGDQIESIYNLPQFLKLDSVMLDRVYIVILTSSFLVLVSSATWIGSQGTPFVISYLIILITAWLFSIFLILVVTSWLSKGFTQDYVTALENMGAELGEQKVLDRAAEIPDEDLSARKKVYKLVAVSAFILGFLSLLSILFLPQVSLAWATAILCLLHFFLAISSFVQFRMDYPSI